MATIFLIRHDENEDAMANVARTLSDDAEWTVVAATHGLEALLLLANTRFDAVLVDVRSPWRDAVALADIIRECPRRCALPILALVSDLSLEEHVAMRAAGVTHVVSLPCAPTVLRRSVQATLRATEAGPKLLASSARLAIAKRHVKAEMRPLPPLRSRRLEHFNLN